MEIREIRQQDKEGYLRMLDKLDRETKFMLFEPGERQTNADKVVNRLREVEEAGHEVILVAENEGELIGYIEGHGGSLKRNRYSVYVVIGVLREYRNSGVGTELLKTLEAWAEKREIHRLELTVMEHNRPAMMLYAKQGFHVEGMRKHALYVDGRFVNEFYMAKILGNEGL